MATTSTTTGGTVSGANSGVNWSNVGVGISLAGNLTSTTGSFSTSLAQAKSYKAQASYVLDNAEQQVLFEQLNHSLSDQAYASDRVELMKGQQRRMASIHTAYAAEGLEMEGTPLVVMAEQAEADARDLAQLDQNAQIEAFQSQVNCLSIQMNAEYEANMLKIQAKYAKRSAYTNLFSCILSSIGSAAYGYGMSK